MYDFVYLVELPKRFTVPNFDFPFLDECPFYADSLVGTYGNNCVF